MRQLDDITNSTEKSLSKLWEIVKDRETLWTGSAAVHRVEKIWTRLRLNNKGAKTKQLGKRSLFQPMVLGEIQRHTAKE